MAKRAVLQVPQLSFSKFSNIQTTILRPYRGALLRHCPELTLQVCNKILSIKLYIYKATSFYLIFIIICKLSSEN